MDFRIPANKLPFSLIVKVKSKSPETIRIKAKDNRKPSTLYINRKGVVNGEREFELKFPLSPSSLIVSVFNEKNGNFPSNEDSSFEVSEIKVEKLKTYELWTTEESRNFIQFAKEFAENASVLSSGSTTPHIYRSNDAKFTIDYYDIIRDKVTGKKLSTPARIGHNSGIIEVSKKHFLSYTVPMRMVILLHEFAHKFLNPTIGRPISYETGADIQALNIYLSLGFSELEAHQAFLYVFKNADTEENHKRYKIINDFITKFNKGQVAAIAA
jgi:hypothetical protein